MLPTSSSSSNLLRSTLLWHFRRMTTKIEKLCDLLAEVDEKKADAPDQNKKNVQLRIFRVEQRLEDVERQVEAELARLQNGGDDDISKQDLVSLEGLLRPVTPANSHQSVPEQEKHEGLKALLAKEELVINELSLRLSEVESSLSKIEPNNIRALIRNIAELVTREEKKEVTAEMDTLKGSQRHHDQLQVQLREELKLMDERFRQDIQRKIEKKELFNTKNQLRRRVLYLVLKLYYIVARTRTKIEGEGPGGRERLPTCTIDGHRCPAAAHVQFQVLLLQPGGQT